MQSSKAISEVTYLGTLLLFYYFVLGVSAAGPEDGRNRPTKAAENGTQRYQLAGFDFAHVETPYVISLWILLASVAKIGFHLYNKLSSIFPESCLLIVMGVVVGIILYFSKAATAEKYTLSPNTFFLFLLPPIVLDAGYFMPNRAFFDNIGTILLFAVVGTLFNTLTIGAAIYGVGLAGWIGAEISLLHCFVFSSLISAVDPVAVLAVFEEIHVNEMLYIIVFGESLLNDAVTVVLYHMMETYSEIGEEFIQPIDIVSGIGSFFVVGICGTLIGILFGFLCGFITKYTDHVRVIEPLFVFVLSYLSYLTSEMLHLSGILAIVFCGIVMKQYVEANVSQKSHTTIKYFMKMLSNISETIIFMFLGLSTVIDNHDWNVPFILFTVLFTLVFRALGVVILTWFANRIRLCRLTKVDQFVMSYGGLRGAIALGLVLLLKEDVVKEKRMMVTACIVVVFFTVFVQGITIKPLVNFLKVKKADKRTPSMNEQINDRLMDHIMAGIEDVAGYYGHHYLRDKYELFNNKYLKPLLMRDNPKTRETKIFHVFTKLNMKEAMDHLALHGSFNMLDMAKEPSLAKIIRNYSEQSLAENGNDNIGEANAEEMQKSETVLDMAAVEAKYSRKMADDSKIHHILDDAMFVPRRRFSTSQKHVLPDLHNHPPFKHNLRKEIRHLASMNNKDRAKTTKSTDGTEYTENQRPHKNVSFSHSMPARKAKRGSPQFPIIENMNEDEDIGIIFTAKHSNDDSDAPNDTVEGRNNLNVMDRVAIETRLPWRRQSVRDESPNLSVAPSWANNLSYHDLTENGSPYTTPQSSIKRPEQTKKTPSVFHIFNSDKADDTDSALAMSYECLDVCPSVSEGEEQDDKQNRNESQQNNMEQDSSNGAFPYPNDMQGQLRYRARDIQATPSGYRDSGVIDSDDNNDTVTDGSIRSDGSNENVNVIQENNTEETKL